MINKLIELKLIKQQLIILTASDLKLKSVDEKLYDDFSFATWNQLLDLVDRALQLIDIKITADTSDDLLNQVVDILADYALAKFMFTGVNIDCIEVIKQLKNNLACILMNNRDNC